MKFPRFLKWPRPGSPAWAPLLGLAMLAGALAVALALALAVALGLLPSPANAAEPGPAAQAEGDQVDRIRPGSKVILLAEADGSPAPAFTWYKNGTEILQGPRFELAAFAAADAGRYHVKATNPLGSALSPVLELVPSADVGPPEIVEFRMRP